ncbi:cytochrome c biogenesis protein [Arthrobacter sp. Hiyo4]|nr:cytochrome c biogenesis protein [Arthrobacter sp. Hiyo4]
MNSPFAETILNGSLLLAIPVALLAGLVSFLSPCVLPLVPATWATSRA